MMSEHLFKTLLSGLKSGELPSIVGSSISEEQARQINEILLLRKKEIDDYVKFMINPHLESLKRIPLSLSPFRESDNKSQIHNYDMISENERKQKEFERVPSESSRFS